MIAKRTTTLTACATLSGLILAALPAHAAARLAGTAGSPALACTYQVTDVRSGAVLNIRSGAGKAFGPVGTLRTGEAPVAGTCTSVNGWVRVKTATGVTGWVPSGNLRKLASPLAVTGRPALACTYRVNRIDRDQYVNLRSGADKTFHPVGKLRVADGRLAGACTSVNGWVRIKSASGVIGWASASHLRKVRNAGPVGVTGRPTLACTYQVTHVRRVSFLNVRSGAGLRFRPVARLRVADGRFAGACKPTRGWVKVMAANGRRGWASAGYLRKVTK
ncbi:SH3 domain-containing protein [Streptosporangium sp. NPDC001681]|uniref:SH3 domain-containing protein n=1 Tax=Streptosporangium sp. NPDC001681 TaxID=3154395 RepID=UPI003333B774